MKAYIVDKEDLTYNVNAIREYAGNAVVWGVVKGNGYGLGIAPMVHCLKENGIDHFAVTEAEDAQAIRNEGFADPILMLRPVSDPAEINILLDLGVILTVGSCKTASAVNAAAGERSDAAEVHIAIDTGMGRYGFLPTEANEVISLYNDMKNLKISGIYTHFYNAFCSKKATKDQYSAFMTVVDAVRQAGHDTGMVHCCNSAAFLQYPEMHCDAVRVGSALLGRAYGAERLGLRKIGYAETVIDDIRWLPKGFTIGYGAGYVVKKPVRVGVIDIGCHNGFIPGFENDLYRIRDSIRGVYHHLKNIFIRKWIFVTVNGHKCRVLGHIGMLHAVVDVTDISCSGSDKVIVEIKPLNVKNMKVIYR